jgi:hypothetical protein
LILKFPENREFNREFSGIRGQFGALGANSRSHFNVLSANSLLSRKQRILEQFQCVAGEFPEMAGTGNFFAGTGNLSGGTGNFFSLIDSRKRSADC